MQISGEFHRSIVLTFSLSDDAYDDEEVAEHEIAGIKRRLAFEGDTQLRPTFTVENAFHVLAAWELVDANADPEWQARRLALQKRLSAVLKADATIDTSWVNPECVRTNISAPALIDSILTTAPNLQGIGNSDVDIGNVDATPPADLVSVKGEAEAGANEEARIAAELLASLRTVAPGLLPFSHTDAAQRALSRVQASLLDQARSIGEAATVRARSDAQWIARYLFARKPTAVAARDLGRARKEFQGSAGRRRLQAAMTRLTVDGFVYPIATRDRRSLCWAVVGRVSDQTAPGREPANEMTCASGRSQ